MHKLIDNAIDHPRFVLVVTLLVLVLAVFIGFVTPVQRTPAITKAVILVAIPHPDSQPTDTEEEITRKIEDALTSLRDVDFISSTSLRGSSVTQIVFLDGVKPEEARGEVQDLVERVRNELPQGREVQPVVTDIDFESMPLMLMTIRGPDGFDQRTLKQIAEAVQEDLETVPGVANTQLFGGLEREIHINVNPDLVSQYGLTLTGLRRALADAHAAVSGGALETQQFDRSIRNDTKIRGVEDLRQIVVRRDGSRLIRMADVAEVVDTHRRVKNVSQVDGTTCATIIVNKEANINTLGAAQAINARMVDLRQQYPDLRFAVTQDTSEEISLMFRVLGSSALFGAMLVLIILTWSMGFRISILVLMAVPFSSAVALVFLYASDIPVSNMVIFSFMLVLGMVVDGAIIVAENIHRHIERGEDPTTAAKVGIHEVAVPVIAADLTTVAAFLPMLLVPGIMGDFLSVMPKVVSVALVGSMLVDHFLIPTLAARWYRRREPNRDEAAAFAAVTVGDSSEISIHDSRIRPDLGLATRAYAGALRFALENRWFVIAWCGIAVFGATIVYRHIGFVFFPPSDRGQFTVKYELPLGYSIDETIAAAIAITEPLEQFRRTRENPSGELLHYVTAIGSTQSLAMRLENDPATGPEFGEVKVQLLSPLERVRHEDEVIARLREDIKVWPGMKYEIKKVEEGPPGGPDVAVRLTGKDLSKIGNLVRQITARLKTVNGTVDATSDYRSDNPELVIEPKADVVGLFGMTRMQVARAVQTAISGDNTIQITLDDEDVTLRLQLAPEFRRYSDDLNRLMLTSPSGRKATVGQLVNLRRDTGLYSVNRYDRNRAATARCDVVAPTVPDDVFKVLREEILPEFGFRPVTGDTMAYLGTMGTASEGVRAKFTGENEERDKNFRYLLRSMGIGVILIFVILVMQFNSFRQAGVVLVSVPLSFIGVVIGMWVCGFPFSLASFIGLVSLTGIVVNDAIVMVDFANQARRRGLPVKEALIEAGVNRLRPVMLTTVTTIGGLLPLLLNISGGAEFWQPLTGAVVFGLAFASILTLVVIPVCYSLVYNFTDSRHRAAVAQ